MVFERALRLSEISCAKLYVLHVIPESLPYAPKSSIAMDPGISEYMRQESEETFKSVKKRLEEKNISGETVLLEGEPAEEILSFIKENKIELVILGSREKLQTKDFLGSVSRRVAGEACSSVLIERII
jgi:nucleotide-binding universal stress UspA family protein